MTRFIRGYDGMVSDPKPRRSSAPKADLVKPKQPEYSFWRDTIWYRDDPGLKTWFRSEWRDLLPLLLFILIPLSMSLWAKPLTPKYFPLPPVAGSAYSYPLLPEYINTWVSAVVSFGVPFAVMGLISIFRIGSFWDCNSAQMGLGYAMATACMFQIFVKWLIGGMRPHFYAVCRPGNPLGGMGPGFNMYTPEICTGNSKEIQNALMSFPSGHATAAFAGFGFLALWLNAKFKVFADYKSRVWQLALFSLPILIAFLLAMSKVVDYSHHWWDVLVGSLIGTFFAFMAYRQVYWAIWDWRYNHIPLPYHWQLHEVVQFVIQEVPNTSLKSDIDGEAGSYIKPAVDGKAMVVGKIDTYGNPETHGNHPYPNRDLTAIDFAGWRNKHSRKGVHKTDEEKTVGNVGEPMDEEKTLAGLDGQMNVGLVDKGLRGTRMDMTRCLV